MSLFQKSIEKKYLNELDSTLIDNKFAEFKAYFGNSERQENIRNSKEEQFQEGFLRELFVKIFGYTLNPEPNFNLTTEQKNITDSKKADGAILKEGNVIAVIELKSTDTNDLKHVELQAFGYKNHHPLCKYVITSNFEKLRFYIQNAVDYIEFDLFRLSKEEFSLMWLCLAKVNLINNIPLIIKESSLSQEYNITKQLYSDYSKFREDLFQNLVKNNPDVDKLTLFKKTQKLIDRFLFIFFAEDKQLLPANSIIQVIEKWKDDNDFGDEKPLYSMFKKYFHILNVGRPKSEKRQEIFAYNGGLFQNDEVLENIIIDDEILKAHTLRLSKYDFETDVDVNILGHIFEHSLGEIETVQAEIRGEQVDTQKTKRKRDGIFYTPKYITKYIVDNTLGKLCEEKRNKLGIVDEDYAKGRRNRRKETIKELDDKLKNYQEWLLTLTILDPACGSGAFLNQALEFLILEHRKIDELRAILFGDGFVFSDISTDILERNIYGVDINDESVEIAKLSLWLRTAKKGRKLNTLNNNIKCGNSLIDDHKVAGEKAFIWHKEFPNVFKVKQKKAWHVTFALHNSRYALSDKFIKKQEPGFIATIHPELTIEEQVILAEELCNAVLDYNLNVMECNVCSDHVHAILVCEEEELNTLMGKWKGRSAFTYNRRINPSIYQKEANYSDGTIEKFWAKSFHSVLIESDSQLEKTINYIRNNRFKHGLETPTHGLTRGLTNDTPLPTHGLTRALNKLTCSHKHAFRTEYKGGFDVVIGNPPYVRAELLGFFRDYLSNNYEVFNPSGDLFSYFYEKSFKLLTKGGLFGFISNTFDKTTAGVSVRAFIQNEVEFINYVDFTEVQIFEGATTYPVIIIAKNRKQSNPTFQFIKIPKSSQAAIIDIDCHKSVLVNQAMLSKEGWSFKSDSDVQVIKKINSFPTINELYGKSFRGILTGLNEAFIIPSRYQEGKHIKPIYEGKELEKWVSPKNTQQLILFQSKWTKERYGENITEGEAVGKLKSEFPDLIDQILKFEERAKSRYDKGDFFWELRNCAYYDLFEKPKIIFPNLQNSNKFAYDESGTFINAPAVMLPTTDKFLLAILNSKLVWYFLSSICVVRNGGYIEVKPQYFEQIPIPKLTENQKEQLTSLTNEVISKTIEKKTIETKFVKLMLNNFPDVSPTKKIETWFELTFRDFKMELDKQKVKISLSQESEWMDFFETQAKIHLTITSEVFILERKINHIVYTMYGLTEEEISIVENNI